MGKLLKFSYVDDQQVVKQIEYIECNGHKNTPESIFKDLVKSIKELNIDKYHKGLTFENLIKRICELDDYSDQIEEGDDWIEYSIGITYEENMITFEATCVNDPTTIIYKNRYVINLKNEGNCIDDFIKRGVTPQIENINDLVSNINSRITERKVATEYHRTMCYEHDFAQIILIKKFAQKIVDNCNTQLENISEFYTKLS